LGRVLTLLDRTTDLLANADMASHPEFVRAMRQLLAEGGGMDDVMKAHDLALCSVSEGDGSFGGALQAPLTSDETVHDIFVRLVEDESEADVVNTVASLNLLRQGGTAPTTIVRHLLQSAGRQLRLTAKRLQSGAGDGDLRRPLFFSACVLAWDSPFAQAATGEAVRSKPWLFEAALDAFARDVKRRAAFPDPLKDLWSRLDATVARHLRGQSDWRFYSRQALIEALRALLAVSIASGKHLAPWMIRLHRHLLLADLPSADQVRKATDVDEIAYSGPRGWQEVLGQPVAVERLAGRVRSSYFDRPLILHGPDKVGKTALAKLFAKAGLCRAPTDGNPCDCCEACHYFDLGSTMGFVPPLDASRNDARDLFGQLLRITRPSGIRGRLIGIVDRIDACGEAVADVLLKTIEEPPSDLCLILLTSNLSRVRPGIRSRCEILPVVPLSQDNSMTLASKWSFAHGTIAPESVSQLVALLGAGLPAKLRALVDKICDAGEIDLKGAQRLLGADWAAEMPIILAQCLSALDLHDGVFLSDASDSAQLERAVAGLSLLFENKLFSGSASSVGRAAFLGLSDDERRDLRGAIRQVAAAWDIGIGHLWQILATALSNPGLSS